MGRPKKVVNTESGNHPTVTVVPGASRQDLDPMKAKIEEVMREKELMKVKPKAKLFDVQLAQSKDDFEWITQSFCNFFKLGPVAFRQNVSAWNFPKAIGETRKTHKVKRQYVSRGIMVDVFDKGTKISEINRIKAHLESLGNIYTYVLGGDQLGGKDFEKLVFETRLKKLDPKDKNYPKVMVPKTLAEAGFGGHAVTMA